MAPPESRRGGGTEADNRHPAVGIAAATRCPGLSFLRAAGYRQDFHRAYPGQGG